jgi:TolA-binding protein
VFPFYKTIIIMQMVFILPSCVSWWSSESSKQQESDSQTAGEVESAGSSESSIAPSTDREIRKELPDEMKLKAEGKVASSGDVTDQLGLAQARIIERMAEIELELRQQREQIKLLERGLITGIAPSDLKGTSNSKNDVKHELSGSDSMKWSDGVDDEIFDKSSSLPSPILDPATLTAAGSNSQQSDESSSESLQLALEQAKKIYQSGDFSKALASFAKISRDFGENSSEGILRYWFGKCYLGSKEFNTAKSEFENYLAIAPSGAYVADARLELARALANLGLNERARAEFRKVIKDFEGQEPAQIAVHELTSMQGAL